MLGLLFTGCVPVPVRLPPQIAGQSGVSADQSFLKVGQTSKDEVLRNLGWADTGMRESRLFWGRWTIAKSRIDMILLVPGALGSYQGDLNWSTHNLLVEFDMNGIVSRAREIKNKDVVRELVAWSGGSASQSANSPALFQESFPALTNGWRPRHGLMSVRSDSLEFFDQQSRMTFNVANVNVTDLKMEPKSGGYSLKFNKTTPWGKEISVHVEPWYLLALLRHLRLTQI